MKTATIFFTCLLMLGCSFSGEGNKAHASKDHGKKKEKKIKGGKKSDKPAPQITIVRRWDLPAVLREVSGIAWLDKDRFACVQDEVGSIYIYNHSSNSIEQEIPFSGPGDFEGLTMVGNAAYIIRSDGMLYEVSDIYAKKPVVKKFRTPLTATQNIEGVCYDSKSDRLLLAVKDKDSSPDYKGIYQFDINTKTLKPHPVYKILLDDDLAVVHNGKKDRIIRPSAIGKYPGADMFYILDGPNAGLLVMDSTGRLDTRYNLGTSFAQPEGISFSPEGVIYVSNEGKKKPANIMEIKLNR